MVPEDFLKELQKAYLKTSPRGYGEKVPHSDIAAGFAQPGADVLYYYQEIERIKKSGRYRFKVLIDDESITLFEPFF